MACDLFVSVPSYDRSQKVLDKTLKLVSDRGPEYKDFHDLLKEMIKPIIDPSQRIALRKYSSKLIINNQTVIFIKNKFLAAVLKDSFFTEHP